MARQATLWRGKHGRYTRKHELLLFVLGTGGFLGLLLAGTVYTPGGVWLRDAGLAWFLAFGALRCLALLTVGHGGEQQAETSSFGAGEGMRPDVRSAETAASSAKFIDDRCKTPPQHSAL